MKKSPHAEELRVAWTGDPDPVDIGERLEVLKDYPTPPNCTSPFAPAWINEIVGRRGGA